MLASRSAGMRSTIELACSASVAMAMTALAVAGMGRVGTVVPLQRDHRHARREVARKNLEVSDIRGEEGIDRLRVVSDSGQAASVRLQRGQDPGQQAVEILGIRRSACGPYTAPIQAAPWSHLGNNRSLASQSATAL